MRVHSELGPGLLENAYRACLCRELDLLGLKYQTEVPIQLTYRGLTLQVVYRIDILVEDVVIVETKAISSTTSLHEAQLLSHLRSSKKPVGLMINFHVLHLRDGITRKVNNFRGGAGPRQ